MIKHKDIIQVTIPRISPTLNRWQRMHFRLRKKEKNLWVQHFIIAIGRPKIVIEKCNIKIERHACGVLPDVDNLYASAKPILDALVDCNIIVNDSPEHILNLDVESFSCGRLNQRTVITISDINK